jgi:hypothetical protein
MNKKVKSLLTGTLLMTAGLISKADAHHPEVLVSTECIDYDYSRVNITAYAWDVWDDGSPVFGDRRHNSDVKVFLGNKEVGENAFTEANNYRFTVSVVVPNTERFLQARVTAVGPWGLNGQYEDDGQARTAFVRLPESCGEIPLVGTPTTSSVTTTTRSDAIFIERDFNRPAEPIPVKPRFTG